MAPPIITVAVEGWSDAVVAAQLLGSLGLKCGTVHGQRGKQGLNDQLKGFNLAAVHQPWLVLRDLDSDAPCPGELIRKLLPNPSPHMRFRLAVKAIEAWLLADSERIASFLGIASATIPPNPDSLPNPKRALVELATRSTRRAIREDMVPKPGLSSVVGPAYASRIAEFARGHWRPLVAARRSTSLARCVRALQRLGPHRG